MEPVFSRLRKEDLVLRTAIFPDHVHSSLDLKNESPASETRLPMSKR